MFWISVLKWFITIWKPLCVQCVNGATNAALYLCTHVGCRAETGVDGSSIEIWVRCRVIRKIVDSLILLKSNISFLTQHQRQDIQTHTQNQHSWHCEIMEHTETAEKMYNSKSYFITEEKDSFTNHSVFCSYTHFKHLKKSLKIKLFRSQQSEVTLGTWPDHLCHGSPPAGAALQSVVSTGDNWCRGKYQQAGSNRFMPFSIMCSSYLHWCVFMHVNVFSCLFT